jgi:hypothetical protein
MDGDVAIARVRDLSLAPLDDDLQVDIMMVCRGKARA